MVKIYCPVRIHCRPFVNAANFEEQSRAEEQEPILGNGRWAEFLTSPTTSTSICWLWSNNGTDLELGQETPNWTRKVLRNRSLVREIQGRNATHWGWAPIFLPPLLPSLFCTHLPAKNKKAISNGVWSNSAEKTLVIQLSPFIQPSKVRFLVSSGWLASNQHLVPNSDWEKKVDMSPKWSTQQRKERGESCKKRRMWWPLPDCSFFFTTPPSVTGCRARKRVSEHLTLIRSAWHKFSQEDYNYIRKREKAFLTFTIKVMFHSLKNQSTISFQGASVLSP